MFSPTMMLKLIPLLLSLGLFSFGNCSVCNVTSEAILESINIEIFANSTAKVSVVINNETLGDGVAAALEMDGSSIDQDSVNELSNVSVQFIFESIPYGSYDLDIRDSTGSVLDCQLNATKTDAVCENETSANFDVSWENGFVFTDILSTQPSINSEPTNQANSFTFSDLDAGYGYSVQFLRSSTTDGVETLIYEDVHCVTEIAACNFLDNLYVESVSVMNLPSQQVRLAVELKNTCDMLCETVIDNQTPDTGSEFDIPSTDAIVIGVRDSNNSNTLFSCSLERDGLTWDPIFFCSDQRETAFAADIAYDYEIQNPIATSGSKSLNVDLSEDNTEVNVSLSDLVPDTNHTFMVTHERSNNIGIQYKDEFSCQTITLLDNFTINSVGKEKATVTWDYPLHGKADSFKIKVQCKSTPHCDNDISQVPVNRTNQVSTFTKSLEGLSASNTYYLTVAAVIGMNTSDSNTLTIDTEPSDVIFDEDTECEVSPTKINITWTHPESDYEGIKYRINSTELATIETTFTHFLFANLEPEIWYTFEVSAVWKSSQGDSKSTSCKTIPVPEPSNLTSEQVSSTVVKLRWQKVDIILEESVEYEVICNEGSACPDNFPSAATEDDQVEITDLIPGKVYNVSVRSLIETFSSGNVSIEIRTQPPYCNVSGEDLLNSITVNIFEDNKSNISVVVNNDTLVVGDDFVWLESASAPIDSNFEVSSDGFLEYNFNNNGLDLFVLNIANGTRDNIIFSCSLDVHKPDEAVCSTEYETGFSISWTEELENDAVEISSDPDINKESIKIESTNATFNNLDPGHGYTIHFVRDIGENGVEILINEILHCATDKSHCVFSNNLYIERVKLTNVAMDQVEIDIRFTESCPNCEIDIASLNGTSISGEGNTRTISNTEDYHFDVTDTVSSKVLFECNLTSAMLTWSSNSSCSNETETTFVAEIEFDLTFQNVVINVSDSSETRNATDDSGNSVSATFDNLDPGTTYNLVATYERDSNGILYTEMFSCDTNNIIPVEMLELVTTNVDNVIVSWNYPSIGEADSFDLTWTCKQPSTCSEPLGSSSSISNDGSKNFTDDVRELSPATTYELSLVSKIKEIASAAKKLTVNTKPTKVDINASSDCQSSPTTINVTWTHSERGYDGLEYRIVLDSSIDVKETADAISHEFDTLEPDRMYNFSISAHRESVDGDPISFTCMTSPVPEIKTLTVVDTNQTMVKLSWSYVDLLKETVEFEVYCQGSVDCPKGELHQAPSDKEIQIDNLLPGEEFIFIVRALVNNHPSSNASQTVRTKLNAPDLSNLTANSPDNMITLPVFDCNNRQKVLNVTVYWTNKNAASKCDEITEFELHEHFQVPVESFENICDNTDFQLNPVNSTKGVNYGEVICVELILQSGEETSKDIEEVPLYPDSVSNLRCPSEDITTSTIRISWDAGQGSVLEYIVTPSNSDFSSQLPDNLTETSFNFSDIPHGILLDFSVSAMAVNGLESQEKTVQCRAKVKVPEFSADVEDNQTQMKIDTEVEFTEAVTMFSIEVYNRSTENNCDELPNTVSFSDTYSKNQNNLILSNQQNIFPGGVYCVKITTSTADPLSESESNLTKVALFPEIPVITAEVENSTFATVEITNYQEVIFDRIEYALTELVWDSTNSDWTSQEFRKAQAFETTEVDFSDLPKGTVLIVAVRAFSFANLSAFNETRFQTKPDTPEITHIETTNTSCTFTVAASNIVTKFEEKKGEFRDIPGDDLTKNFVTAVFTFSGLEAHTEYQYEFYAISKYENFNSKSDEQLASCRTEHGPPSKVRNLQITPTDPDQGKYDISWEEPETPNGPIDGYNITYAWTRVEFPSSIETMSTTLLSTTDVFIAEGFNLTVTVFAFNDVNGIPTSLTKFREATTKPKANQKYNNTEFQSGLGEKSKSSLTVFIPCDLFEQPTDINDPTQNSFPLVAFYRMIVATGSSLNLEAPPTHLDLSTQRSDSVYYASDKIKETPCDDVSERSRRSTEKVEKWNFTVGSGSKEDCQPEEDFCNPMLKAGKKYVIFTRAFSDEDTYQDVKLGAYRTSPPGPNILLIVILVIVSAILIVLIALVVAFVFRRFQRGDVTPPKPKPREANLPTIRPDSVDVSRWSKPIEINRFQEEYDMLCRGDGFRQEFVEFTRAIVELDLPQRIALNPYLNGQNENCPKNRWGDILPYDRRLVPLEDGYINASFISGERSEKEYIATQGPMSHTEGDFWQMIWEHNVMQIVMLCQPVEMRNGAPKNTCHPYWPEERKIQLKGNVMTALLKSDDAGKLWTRRVIKVQMRGMTPGREVIQYHYNKWDDRSSARWEELEPLIRLVDQENINSPIVVHCSAGVGRTGTFIMLHRMLRQTQYCSAFDIRGMVAQMRTMRPCMVQTVAQYKFVHDVGLILAERMTRNGVWAPEPHAGIQPIASPRTGVSNAGFNNDGPSAPTKEELELDSWTLDSEHNNNGEQDETSLIDFASTGNVNPLFAGDSHLV